MDVHFYRLKLSGVFMVYCRYTEVDIVWTLYVHYIGYCRYTVTGILYVHCRHTVLSQIYKMQEYIQQ